MMSRDIFRYWVPVAAYMALIFFISSIPAETIGAGLPIFYVKLDPQQLFLHMVEYGILGVLLYRATSNSHPHLAPHTSHLTVLSMGVFYGLTDEIHQMYVPGRFASVEDLVADSLGIMVGSIVGERQLQRITFLKD